MNVRWTRNSDAYGGSYDVPVLSRLDELWLASLHVHGGDGEAFRRALVVFVAELDDDEADG